MKEYKAILDYAKPVTSSDSLRARFFIALGIILAIIAVVVIFWWMFLQPGLRDIISLLIAWS